MTTQYAEEQGFKKKYLAPLIVLLLCAVSLTGAAYAYSTSIEGNGDVDGDYYSIDLYTDSSGAADKVLTMSLQPDKHFEVSTSKTVGGNYSASVEETTVTFTTYVKVQSNTTGNCKITGTATYDNKTNPEFYDGWDALTCTVLIDNQSAQGEFTGAIGTTYKVTIQITLPAISESLGTSDPADIEDLLLFNGDNAITLTMTAVNA
jgi:hypothetical protein